MREYYADLINLDSIDAKRSKFASKDNVVIGWTFYPVCTSFSPSATFYLVNIQSV